MPHTTPSIAIVDDSRIIREIARKVIYQMNYSVLIEAVNGLDLLAQLEGLWILPDICLLDLEMPDMDGFETAIALRRNYPLIKVLAYSSNASQEYITRIYACGVCDFLPKESDLPKWKQALARVAMGPGHS